jgi:hypothetical protein
LHFIRTIAMRKDAVSINPGDRFNKWTVIDEVEKQGGCRAFECLCDCGESGIVRLYGLRSGKSGGCGCIQREKATKHGHAKVSAVSRTWNVWSGMKSRCRCKTHKQYEDYGGRGIKVCDRWDVFSNFLADMGKCPTGRSIDRIDNNGNYEPSNCRWATPKQQARNKRNNRLITCNGNTRTLSEWSEITGIKRENISMRIKKGWPVEKALSPMSGLR